MKITSIMGIIAIIVATDALMEVVATTVVNSNTAYACKDLTHHHMNLENILSDQLISQPAVLG